MSYLYRVHIYQQPEDALAHGLKIHLGVAVETMQLVDVMTFIDPLTTASFSMYLLCLKPV